MTRLENGQAASWRLDGWASASAGRDPGDGRWLWAVRWYRINPRLVPGKDGAPDFVTEAVPERIVQGKVSELALVLTSIAQAHRDGRPE